MKKISVIAAALAAICIGFASCAYNEGDSATAKKYSVTVIAVNGNGTLTAEADGKALSAKEKVAPGTTVKFTAVPKTKYEIDKWTITGGTLEEGGTAGSTTAKVKITSSDINVNVTFKWTGGAFESNKTYKGDIKLSCFVDAMGGVDFGAGQPDKGEKYKSLLEGADIAFDSEGKAKITARFRKSAVSIHGINANTFIDPRNSTPGYYDTDGVKKDADFTISSEGETATPPEKDPAYASGVRYVTLMTFPVSTDASVYNLWIYVNSSVMGVQFCDGSGTAGAGEPNKATRFIGKITIDWSTLTEQ